MGEEWRPVVGHEGAYEVSNLGRVRSRVRNPNGRIMSGAVNSSGRIQVKLAGKLTQVHRVVMEAFVGPVPDGLEVLHWDDDPTNNALSNLRYGTRGENLHDLVRNGKHFQANKVECPHGHPYSAENTRRSRGKRICITCSRSADRERLRRERKLNREAS